MKVGLKTAIAQVPQKIAQAPKQVLNGVNGLGSTMRELTKENVDKFASSKVGAGLKKAGVNKDTAIGVGLILLAVSQAVRIGKGIANRVNESKQVLKD